MILQRISATGDERLAEIVAGKVRAPREPPWALVFDFDGVLSSKSEDWIFRLDESPGEAERLQDVASAFALNLASYDVPYQRHLLYQAAAAELRLPIEPGPALRAATHATAEGAKLYVLTARSGLQATRRMNAFLEERGIRPTETYQIGRVAKDRQIRLVLDSLPDHHVLFVEDAEEHVNLVMQALGESDLGERLEIVLIEHDATRPDDETLRRTAWSVLERGAERLRRGAMEEPHTRFEQLTEALDHARSLFVYHAGQRHASLRYFFAAMALFVATFVGVVTVDSSVMIPYQQPVALLVGITMVFVAVFFWALDYRNAMLVDCDEDLMREAESELADLTRMQSFQIVLRSDTRRPTIFRYSTLLPAMFMLFILFALGSVYMALQLEPRHATPGSGATTQQVPPARTAE